MTQEDMEELAQRISDLGAGLDIRDLLGALGIVVVQALMQLPKDERMPGAVGWIAVLSTTLTRSYVKSRNN